jgi:hypothetical protein
MLVIGFEYIALIMCTCIPSILSFFQGFYCEGMMNFVKGIFCIYWGDHVIFVLDFIYVLYYVYQFACVKPSLHLWNETNLIIVYVFNVLFSLAPNILLTILYLCWWRNLASGWWHILVAHACICSFSGGGD